jgi:hypothetical protein
MSSQKLKHNRKRNVGIVYELLMRHLTKQTIDKNKPEWTKTYNIIAKYYAPGQPLAEELKHLDLLRQMRNVSNTIARKVLFEVVNTTKKLDRKLLDIKKSNLIKEINHTFGKGFFGAYRLPEYRLLASIQMLFDESREPNKFLSESVNRIQLEESLINFMTSKFEEKKITLNTNVDSMVYTATENKFKDKYNKALNEHQIKLLNAYAHSIVKNDNKILNERVQEEKVRILTALKAARKMKEIVEDVEMQGKFEETIKRLQEMKESNLSSDKIVEELLLYSKLVEELKSNE